MQPSWHGNNMVSPRELFSSEVNTSSEPLQVTIIPDEEVAPKVSMRYLTLTRSGSFTLCHSRSTQVDSQNLSLAPDTSKVIPPCQLRSVILVRAPDTKLATVGLQVTMKTHDLVRPLDGLMQSLPVQELQRKVQLQACRLRRMKVE